MAETPDNKNIENLLRDYARKRREAAGNPELHPATRRLLQTEVRQQFAQPGVRKSPVGRALRFWPSLAFGTGILALLVITTLLFVPGETKKMKRAAAKPESGSPAPAAKPSVFATAAPTTPGFPIADNELATNLSDAAMPVALDKARPLEVEQAGQLLAAVDLAQVAKQTESEEGALASSAVSSFTAAGQVQMQVLTEFTVQQSDESITVVDRDGSVYKGYARLENAGGPPPAQIAVAQAATDSLRMDSEEKDSQKAKEALNIAVSRSAKTAEARKLEQVVHQAGLMNNYTIYAEGTNRSLNQRVILKGNLMQFAPSTNTQVASGSQIFRQQNLSNPQTNAGPVPSQTLNGVIKGRVQLGSGTPVEFNANSAGK